MVDGVLLLVDAVDGPMPQTRFVVGKALEARLPLLLVVNKVDRPTRAPAEVVDESFDLFLDLGADDEQLDFPIVYCVAKAGTAVLDLAQPRVDLPPLLELMVDRDIPASTSTARSSSRRSRSTTTTISVDS